MHILQPKQTKLKQEEIKKLLESYNISVSQLPKIKQTDPGIPKDCIKGDVIKIERKYDDSDKISLYYRVVI
jgi:DNA-directed RNA polymerase subunit H